MSHAGCCLHLQDTPRRRLKELEHSGVLERRRVGNVDDDGRTSEGFVEAPTREGVDARVGCRGTLSRPCQRNFVTRFEPISRA
jgi:hypothetical protein